MAQVIAPQSEDRIFTAANVFTAIRLLCVPLFVVLLARGHHRGWFPAAVLLAALGATDWVDGQLARRLHQVTRLGRVLDPTADRILLGTATIGILAVGAVPWPVALVALVREGLVAAAAVCLTLAGAGRIDVHLAGKAGTFGLMCALPLFLAGHSDVGWHDDATVAAWCSAGVGLVMGWIAVGTYVPLARAALRQRRSPATEEAPA